MRKQEQDKPGAEEDTGTPPATDTTPPVASTGHPLIDSNGPPSGQRVRFSEDLGPRPQLSHDVADAPKPVPRSATINVVAPQVKGRNRGYSLRRSLFNSNIQKQEPQHGVVLELEPSSSRHSATEDDAKAKQRNSIVSVELRPDQDSTSQEQSSIDGDVLEEEARSRHRSWTKHYRAKSGSLGRLREWAQTLQDRIFTTSALPPTVDGRHIKINTLKDFVPTDERRGQPYISNRIRSCKYTPWNFLPKQLYAQFGKIANFYFLIVSIMQMIPGLSTTGTYTTIIPLLVFVSISMAKEAYDDIRRNRLDKEENERLTYVLDHAVLAQESKPDSTGNIMKSSSGAWRREKWQDLRVGDVVLIERNEPVPADVVLLYSSAAEGIAHIETKSLDGETNLKSKKALDQIAARCHNERGLAALESEFVVEDPNLDLYKFDGRVSVAGQILPLTSSEVVYRGSVLRNTPSAAGLIIYSGEECKIRMNANKNPRVKAPSLQARVNKVVILVASLVVFVAVIESVGYLIWRRTTEDKSWYLQSAEVPFGQILTSFVIMFNTMLPLSLYVSLEIVKVAQMFLMNDVDMYDADSDIPMEARTSTINEELGQVSYVFSDKTGTLTNNSMRFRKMSIAGTAWLHDLDLQEDAAHEYAGGRLRHKKRGIKGKDKAGSKKKHKGTQKSISQSPLTGTDHMASRPSFTNPAWAQSRADDFSRTGKTDELLDYLYHRPNTVFARKARFFLLALALCHTCVPEKDDDGEITYQAASPDELALVTAAQELGFIVTDRHTGTISVKTFLDGDDDHPIYETYQILDVIEFSSARKRMSIILRLPDRRICLFSKGADTTMRNLLRLRELSMVHVNEISRRASARKSVEVQAALQRRSTQIARPSLSIAPMSPKSPIFGRQSSVSLNRRVSVRESIDIWLRERESDAETSNVRKSSTYYIPRNSTQAPGIVSNRPSNVSFDSPRPSFHTEDMDNVIDDALVIDDNATFERCFNHIDDFATEGLRTLLYGHKFITEDEYDQWSKVYHDAATSLVDRQQKIEAAADQIETQLELTGATAIEDKLQRGVPDAIERFRRAGIKIWMLTGDKRETAINIGHSCHLIKDYSDISILNHEQGHLGSRILDILQAVRSGRTAHSVLVVDGQTLTHIWNDRTLKERFTELAILADSVICCRASPSQKADLVRTVRLRVSNSVTLAIGDGANDIAMIQEAHLGIGIAGKEGLQAARSSDYSIGQFRFLLKLLLVHGRWNYVRICKYTLGTFWKEMLFYLVQAIYQRWTGYTGTSLYEPWSLSMFNTLFTSLPVIFMGVFEKDLAASTLLAVPELYSMGQRNQGFNFWVYVQWATLGATESVIVYFTMYRIYGEALFTRDNQLYAMGALAFTACVTVISMKMQFFELHNKTIMAAVAGFLSVGGWWLWNLILSVIYKKTNVVYNVNGGLTHRFGDNPLWWLTLILIVMGISMLEMTLKALKSSFIPSDTETFQHYERDIEVKKRFEESAADLLQQGWQRSTRKSSLEIIRDEEEQARREAEVQEILDRPRTMADEDTTAPPVTIRKRQSWQPADLEILQQVNTRSQKHEIPTMRRSLDVGELLHRGFGMAKKESIE